MDANLPVGEEQNAMEGPAAQHVEGHEEEVGNGRNDDDDHNNNGIQAQQPSPQGPPPFRVDDPSRMKLTSQEHQWALNIKTAIQAHSEIDPITDFMCAHLAIHFQADVESAVESALRLQGYRQDNDLLDTLSDSRRALTKYVNLFPRLFLSYFFNPHDGNYNFVYDITQFSGKKMTRTEMYTTSNAGAFYLCHAMSADFELIRRGVIVICECDGYDWTRHMDIRMIQNVWLELAWAYPFEYQTQKHYNGGVMFNVFLSMLKKIIPAKMGSKFETGYRFDGRLDSVYMVPTVEIANQRLLQSLDLALQRRYDMEESFSLSADGATNNLQ
ncbi:expressed unknown protein [Seminavis robusta]|uniref:CRAL-TRIO domain-containing protein n=1 Tax=Seminavis robusta TaxID=568900 RepID=A0A9N8DIW5_9STRA|nr:expressed unknown protein [Seminavis robusta]|eukprot:Sro145_g067280.1 n/a (328) ;mRNA; r:45181-46164